MTQTMQTPARIWKQMTATQRMAAARAFWSDEEATDDQVQAALLIAQQKKFRPKTVVTLDLDRKTKHLATMPSLPDTIAGRILIVYHLAAQRPMMSRFLDALGIAHEEGLIKEDTVKPDPSKLPEAVAEISREFPSEDVQLYLSTLVCQDPETWGELVNLPEAQDSGLKA
jgi:hypothetical protein